MDETRFDLALTMAVVCATAAIAIRAYRAGFADGAIAGADVITQQIRDRADDGAVTYTLTRRRAS